MHHDRPPVSFNLASLRSRSASLGLRGAGPKAVAARALRLSSEATSLTAEAYPCIR